MSLMINFILHRFLHLICFFNIIYAITSQYEVINLFNIIKPESMMNESIVPPASNAGPDGTRTLDSVSQGKVATARPRDCPPIYTYVARTLALHLLSSVPCSVLFLEEIFSKRKLVLNMQSFKIVYDIFCWCLIKKYGSILSNFYNDYLIFIKYGK